MGEMKSSDDDDDDEEEEENQDDQSGEAWTRAAVKTATSSLNIFLLVT